MLPPEMFIVAGPPGAGKSSVFPLRSFADRVFNADDRAAELNAGSYRDIPIHIRNKVNQEFERFVRDSIAAGRSFALETTLRSSITFEQAKLAGSVGFSVLMIYVALDSFDRHLERVRRRALVGGHAASESTLRRIYESSLRNLSDALNPAESSIEAVRIFDNSTFQTVPKLALETKGGRIVRIADDFPVWLLSALHWSESELQNRRRGLNDRQP